MAVLDTSVLVPHWSRVVLQRLAVEPLARYRPVWSEWIVAETWRVLTRKRVEAAARAGQPVDWASLERQANEMMWYLLPVVTTVPLGGRRALPPPWPGLPDLNDVPVWATAKLAGAEYVVSHNTRHFPPLVRGKHVYDGIEYLTAIEFVEAVLGFAAAIVYRRPIPAGGLVRSSRARAAG